MLVDEPQGGSSSDEAPEEEVPSDPEKAEEIELAAWQQREVERIRKEREEHEQFAKDKAEIERERAIAAAESGAPAKVKEHVKWKFLQKYYHIGSFFRFLVKLLCY